MIKYFANIILVFILCFEINSFAQTCPDSVYTGTTTFYSYTSQGNCFFPLPGSPKYTVAMNAAQYNNSISCGGCIAVTTVKGTTVLHIEDQCPSCPYGNLDISDDVQALISDNSIEAVSWKYVGCPVTGNVQIYFTNASNPFYFQVQIRNHRYPVAQVEIYVNGAYTAMTRQSDNTSFMSFTFGAGPFDFRLTDVTGQVIESKNIPFLKDSLLDGHDQFPMCLSTGINQAVKEEQHIELLNNPSDNGTFIAVNKNDFPITYSVTDLLGKVVRNASVQAQSSEAIQLDANGIYFMNCYSPLSKRVVLKIVVE